MLARWIAPALILFTSACNGFSCARDDGPPAPVAPVQKGEGARPFPLSQVSVPGFPDYRPSHEQHLQLDRMPARWALPSLQTPEEVAAVTDEFVLEVQRTPRFDGALYASRAPLPFPLELDEQTFRPEGLIVKIGEKPMAFTRGKVEKAKKPGWRITGKFLVLGTNEEIEPGSLRAIYPHVRQELDRHDPKLAKDDEGNALTPEAFSHYGYSIRGATRHGLLLVAPTSAEWDVTLPSTSASFETWAALERPPLAAPESDGATLALTVVADGQETRVTELALEGVSDAFTRVAADLTPWAGKQVTVRLSAEPGATDVFDWVFAGSPTIWGPPEGGDVRRVVIVALDTTRPDHLSFFGYGKPTTPEIDKFASSAVAFDKTWSVAPRTRPSFRSSTTGRLPLEAVGATNLSEVFAEHGFATGGIVANPHLQPRFSFDRGYDSWWYDGRALATDQVDRAIEWLHAYEEVDSYLFVHFMDPHMIYDAPEPYRAHFVTEVDANLPERPKRNQVIGMMRNKTLTDVAKAQVVGLHDGELLYTSHELGRLFAAIDALPGRSLVILHSDHGEEFWEHGGFEHNHSLYDELVRTVFVMRPGGGLPVGRRVDAPVSLMDIGPTLYDLFGIDMAPPADGVTLMPVLAGQPAPERPLPVGYLQYDHERWAVIWKGHKYMLHTKDGSEELFDLAADPGETTNLADQTDLTEYRTKLAEAHHIDVGPGYRVMVNLAPAPDGPKLVLKLPAPAKKADILDPEAIVEHRANIEWGEAPRKRSIEVGLATLSEDRMTITFEPGSEPEGILYVLFDEPHDPAGVTATLGGTDIHFEPAERGPTWQEGPFSVTIAPGTVVIPPPTEAARMGMVRATSTTDMELLCILGYSSGPECAEFVQDDESTGEAPELGD